MSRPLHVILCIAAAILSQGASHLTFAQTAVLGILPEQRRIPYVDPPGLPGAPIPSGTTAPPTVVSADREAPQQSVFLDEAIRQALVTSDVVRVLAGVGAANSGRTIYDPAIATTRIDQQQAVFDPTFDTRHDFLRNETPFAVPDPVVPGNGFISGTRDDVYDMTLGVGKELFNGGRAELRTNVDQRRQRPERRFLDPQSRSSLSLQLTQPLLRGAGAEANFVPIVLARIDANTSYFRLKDSVQEMVRGVIQGYWDLVAARVSAWAVQQQVEQAQFAFDLETARRRIGLSTGGQLAQARLAVARFRSNQVAVESALLDREAAFRAVLGIPPTEIDRLVPMTMPTTSRIEFDWEELISLAEQSRPDLIELKLILEADYQLLIQARNNSLPQLDAFMLYRWNGIEGELPIGDRLRSRAGEHTDWRLGVNFSVPLGQRQARAQLRERELVIARDRAVINQAMLEIVHDLAVTLRRVDQQFAQYESLRETREAAARNLRQQFAEFSEGRIQFINVLQAITEWGSAVSDEAGSLSQYNAELATMERKTGTILETHGVRFFEERYASLGPLGLLGQDHIYPRGLRPTENAPRYESSETPVDEYFRRNAPDLTRRRSRSPAPNRDDTERLPPPVPDPPSRN